MKYSKISGIIKIFRIGKKIKTREKGVPMLTYNLLKKKNVSLYESLYESIKADIVKGTFAASEKLPSKRSLAKNLGVSIITVEGAYTQLLAEGYIYSIEKKGYFVCNINDVMKLGLQKKNNQGKKNLSKKEKALKKENIINFADNQTRPENFPFSVWTKILRKTVSEKQIELMTNSPCNGITRLRKAIANHLKQFYGMSVKDEQIVIGAGTEYLYGLLILLLGRDKIYSVENPCYKKIALIYKTNGVACKSILLDSKGLCVEELEKSGADVVHISPSHQFPTGITMPVSRRYELLSWATAKKNRYIIEDDYDSEFRLSGKPIPTLQSIDACSKVIYMNTFSKTLSSTIRISYMVLPLPLSETYRQTLSFYTCTVPTFEQYTLSEFIDGSYFEKHINRMRNIYRNQRNIILETIKNSCIASKVFVSEENAGLHFLLKLKTTLADEKIIAYARRKGVKIVTLSAYFENAKESEEHVIVLSYSGIAFEKTKEATEILCKTLSEIL